MQSHIIITITTVMLLHNQNIVVKTILTQYILMIIHLISKEEQIFDLLSSE